MIWKKAGILLAAAALFVTACSNGDNSSSNDSTTASPNASNASSSAPVAVTWFSAVNFWNPPATWSTDPNTVQGAITEKTGLTFNMNIPAQDGDTKLSLMMVSSGDFPDVMTVTDQVIIKKLIDSGKVWNLEEFLKQYDPESALLKTFPNDLKQALVSRDGGWYAYPSHMSTDDARAIYPPSNEYYTDGIKYRDNNAIMVNKNLLKEAGITLDEIKTEDGLLAAYKKISDMKLKVNGAAVIPLLVDGKDYQLSTLVGLENMFGAMPVDKNGVYRDLLFAPETKHALDFLFAAAQGSYLDPSQLTLDSVGTKAAVSSGRVFSFIGNTANTGFSTQDFWVSPGPILSNQDTKPTLGKSLKSGTGWMNTFISKSTKEPERLAKWLSFMSSDEGMKLHYYGFIDKDYTLNEKGLVVQTDLGKQATVDYATTGISAYWPFHNISWHDSVTEAPTDITGGDGLGAMAVQTALGRAEQTVIYDTSALSLPSDFIAAGSKLANDQLQIDQYKEAQISKIILAKNKEAMETYYNEMIRKLKDLGLDEIDATKNEQIQKQFKEFGVTLAGVNS